MKENNTYIIFMNPGAHVIQSYLAAKNYWKEFHLYEKLSNKAQSLFFKRPPRFPLLSSCSLPSSSAASRTARPRSFLASLSYTGLRPPLPYPHLPASKSPSFLGEIWRQKTRRGETEFSPTGADGVWVGGSGLSIFPSK